MSENEMTCRGSIMLGSACGHCSKCLKEIADMEKALSKVKPKQQAPVGMIGWSCPVCGRGNAPYTSCQGFSFAGKRLNFDDPRSKLFFTFVDILQYVQTFNPKVKFLLENVKMSKESENVITDYLNIKPIEINSSLVSAQLRKRLYWTNITDIPQPQDKGIYLKDIIEEGSVDRDKSYHIDANYYKGGNLEQYFSKSRRQLVFKDFMLLQGVKQFIGDRGHTIDLTEEHITTLANKYRFTHIRGLDDKSKCLSTQCGQLTSTSGSGVYANGVHRSLTPLECERLQTLPDNYRKVFQTHNVIRL